MFKRIRKFKNRKRNRGVVSVEFAFIAPIFFLIVLGSIEFTRIHMIRNAVENACFEGARRGIVPGATNSACMTTAEDLLSMAAINEFSVEVEPSNFDAMTDTITVTATIPINAENGFGVTGLFRGKAMVKEISMSRAQR